MTLGDTDALLEKVQRDSFHFFSAHVNPANGLVRDSSQEHIPCSIAAVGFALTCYPIAVERAWMTRAEALALTLAAVRFFANAEQSDSKTSAGYKGFFYHFLDMHTGCRVWDSELSTIDTALLMGGLLLAARYFDGTHADECEVRSKVGDIYARIDWRWAQNDGAALSLGWTPEKGFISWRWIGYSEALLLYALALGSPTFPVGTDAYEQWLSGYRWNRIYGHELVYAGPLFIHQFSHVWIDFRNIQDAYMRHRGLDYFENSHRATKIQREYARRNPHHWDHYHDACWGMTASNGPGPAQFTINGRQRKFYGYAARGAPYGPDDGTIAPWAVVASLPFAPEIVLPTIAYLAEEFYQEGIDLGFYSSFNPTWRGPDGQQGWSCPWHIGINQGPIVAMIENHRSGMVWSLMRECEPIVRGLNRAGFGGGWLDLI
ncbi:MAG: hypothetical protein L0H70_05890 [Xanthomonadales bacterium]|nr:hypothetical protein [Xanthomonadales bacterium]